MRQKQIVRVKLIEFGDGFTPTQFMVILQDGGSKGDALFVLRWNLTVRYTEYVCMYIYIYNAISTCCTYNILYHAHTIIVRMIMTT